MNILPLELCEIIHNYTRTKTMYDLSQLLLSTKVIDPFINVIKDDRKTIYYKYKNKIHRLDGPAIEKSNGEKCWYLNGKYHRLDGPAIIWKDTQQWYKMGKNIELMVQQLNIQEVIKNGG
jgi:hypothetical protein